MYFKFIRHVCIFVFFSAEFNNLRTHVILRDLKLKNQGKKAIPPPMDGFEMVSCPNYLYEFLSWFCFSIVTMSWAVFLFIVCGFVQMQEWAIKKHKYLKETFGDNYKVKFAFVPNMI